MTDNNTGGGVCEECYKPWAEGVHRCSCGGDLADLLRCPKCGWDTEDPSEPATVLGEPVCQRCTTALEPVHGAGEPAAPEPDPDPEPASDDWEWNPTMRAGSGGPVLDPETGRALAEEPGGGER